MTEILLTLMTMIPSQGGEQGGGLFATLMPLMLIFVIFYFLLIRPQQRKTKQHQSFLDSLERGMEVVTNSGIIGKVTGITRTVITIEVAPKVKMKFVRSAIAGKAPQPGEEAESASK